jgi:hypothetical protein
VEQHLYQPHRYPPRPGDPGREDYEWRVAAARAASREPEEERFFALLVAAARPTGDDQHDLNELGRMLLLIADLKRRNGPSEYLAKAKEVCENTAGVILMRRLTGHLPPYTQAEHHQKDVRSQDIHYGRAEPTIGPLRDFDGSPGGDDDYDL